MTDINIEVKKRWGDKGGFSSNCKRPNGKRSFRVGYIECGFFNVEGEGESWEEALTNADKKHKPTSKCIHKTDFPNGRHYGQGFCLDCMLTTCINFDYSEGA